MVEHFTLNFRVFTLKLVGVQKKKEVYSILPLSIYLMLLSRSFTDHHLRCGGWLNFEFSKRGKTFGMGH